MITFTRLLSDAWGLFRREADLIVRIAAPFVFLPALAVQLIADPLPALPVARDQATIETWLDALSLWGQANAGWYVLGDLVGLYGIATLALVLTDPARPPVGGALLKALRLFPRFVLASVLVAFPVGIGMWLIVLPGLYAQARFAAVLPALAAEQPLGAARALGRSWRVTAPAGWALFGATVTLFLLQWLAISPFAPIDSWLRVPSHLNPFLLALVDAAMAVIAALYHVAVLLLGVVAYRRLANSGT